MNRDYQQYRSNYSSLLFYSSELFLLSNKGTFGYSARFKNFNSYANNSITLKGKLKKYRPSRNIDHINNIEGTELKRNKTSLCFNVGKYKKISRNKNILKDEKESNTISKKGKKNKFRK